MKNAVLSRHLLAATEGLAATLTDTLLFMFYVYGASFGKSGPQGAYQIIGEAQSQLTEVNYRSIKRAIQGLATRKYVTCKGKRSQPEIAITHGGLQRIRELFPRYRIKRPWDQHLYLISYDIPARENKSRNLLRSYIRRTGGALLQESLWINPYDPQALLEDFVKVHRIDGTILISKLGKDSSIGTENLEDLLSRVYRYPQLTDRYNEFIEIYRNQNNSLRIPMTMRYFAILKDDPQLPFSLEPKNFPAGIAYQLYQSYK